MSAGDWKDMYAAAVAGDLALVRYHIGAGVNPNYQHPEILCTPLVASLIHGHAEITRYLLAHGADAGLRSDFDDMTPLEAARRHGRTEFVPLLRARGGKEERKPFWWRWLPI
ncbi:MULTISPECIES: ankyrin repeat domain-containing protein [unclassified Acidovorax]|uniref:ankyrin repeat domain-containing protein n=1 Tax=unclassified Acidovorax TaxID=2684926 RepID=UPI001C4529D9|nr:MULTISPECIES: ankyrin repeat domain-containing protein [unclassified Acidovorax]MBV7429059.1 ankyrin repeat domain-containing protein [Acidovorax sp. sif0732]MBV7450885.1 ankyrin repeat domain-containing protein [Acidovorax sp. sif0715]